MSDIPRQPALEDEADLGQIEEGDDATEVDEGAEAQGDDEGGDDAGDEEEAPEDEDVDAEPPAPRRGGGSQTIRAQRARAQAAERALAEKEREIAELRGFQAGATSRQQQADPQAQARAEQEWWANGAGKSTVLNTLFGLLTPRQGKVRLNGDDITGATQKDLLARGIAFVPQGRNLFGQLSVYENLELGGITLGMKTTHERIPEVLEFFPRVKERINSLASSLSGGEQKQLEIGRALLLRPKVLLIDEPSIGLSPIVVQDVFKLLRQLADQGTTVLMVEQNVKSALKYSDNAIALESGRLVLYKSAAEILADPQMERLFLGGAHTTSAAAATPV